jgi:hypothetical protein
MVCCIRRPTRLLLVNTTATLITSLNLSSSGENKFYTTPGIEVGVVQSYQIENQ